MIWMSRDGLQYGERWTNWFDLSRKKNLGWKKLRIQMLSWVHHPMTKFWQWSQLMFRNKALRANRWDDIRHTIYGRWWIRISMAALSKKGKSGTRCHKDFANFAFRPLSLPSLSHLHTRLFYLAMTMIGASFIKQRMTTLYRSSALPTSLAMEAKTWKKFQFNHHEVAPLQSNNAFRP